MSPSTCASYKCSWFSGCRRLALVERSRCCIGRRRRPSKIVHPEGSVPSAGQQHKTSCHAMHAVISWEAKLLTVIRNTETLNNSDEKKEPTSAHWTTKKKPHVPRGPHVRFLQLHIGRLLNSASPCPMTSFLLSYFSRIRDAGDAAPRRQGHATGI